MDARLLRRVACPATAMQSLAASTPAASSRRLWTGAATCSLLQTTHSSPLIPSRSPSSQPQQQLQHRPADRRYKSTANRTKRALNIAPHASFLGASGTAAAEAAPLGTIRDAASPSLSTTLLYNPPASAPSVYQTPFKFLPKSDPRRRSNLTSLFSRPSSSSSSSSVPVSPELPHRSFAPAPDKYHLAEADVAEIRRLRAADPIEWSVPRLARQFRCSPIFVMLVVRSSAEHRERQQQQAAAVRQRWGPIRTKARADRQKRREMLYSGDL